MASDGRRHLDLMRERGNAVLNAGEAMRAGMPSERHGWLVPGTWASDTINFHRRGLESEGAQGRRAGLAAHNHRYGKFAGVEGRCSTGRTCTHRR
jgi:hypothetical protein